MCVQCASFPHPHPPLPPPLSLSCLCVTQVHKPTAGILCLRACPAGVSSSASVPVVLGMCVQLIVGLLVCVLYIVAVIMCGEDPCCDLYWHMMSGTRGMCAGHSWFSL